MREEENKIDELVKACFPNLVGKECPHCGAILDEDGRAKGIKTQLYIKKDDSNSKSINHLEAEFEAYEQDMKERGSL